jgi:DNA-binding transcriptional MocR family regulator
MPPEGVRLLIDVDTAAEARRELGPVCWGVLEAIASGTPPDQSTPEVACSARSLSGTIGVSKDTVARSLRRLIERGHLVRVEHRDELTGRFEATTYRIDLASFGITVVATSPPQPSAAPHLPARLTTRTHTDQLTLLQ